MSERTDLCARFDSWLLEAEPESDASAWHEHLAGCATCREQWTTHQFLADAFAEEGLPELSPAFDAGLRRKITATERRRPLSGWRLAALAAYALVAVALVGWIYARFTPGAVDQLVSTPLTALGALVVAPLSLWLAAAVALRLPARRAADLRLPAG